jgi:hypothetical protein
MTANSLAGLAYATIWKHLSLPLSKAPGRPEAFARWPLGLESIPALCNASAPFRRRRHNRVK